MLIIPFTRFVASGKLKVIVFEEVAMLKPLPDVPVAKVSEAPFSTKPFTEEVVTLNKT